MNFLVLGIIFIIANVCAFIVPIFPCKTGLVEAIRIPFGALIFVGIYLLLDLIIYFSYSDKNAATLSLEDL